MADQTKRDFLKISAASVVGLPLVSSPLIAATSLSSERSAMEREFYAVYRIWLGSQSIDPVDYLRSRDLNDVDDKTKIRNLSKEDFACGNVVKIKGFVLSKTEAAVLASMGKSVAVL